jgi:hypothetical protein
MKNYKILKNFLSEQECDLLNKWIIDNKDKPFFQNINMGGKRVSTRGSSLVPFPEYAYLIQKRLIKRLNITNVEYAPFYKGMISSYAFPSDTCYLHKDPVWKKGYKTLHCNVILSDCIGGEPLIEDEKLIVNKGDVWCYLVSDVMHGSDKVLGDVSRTMWIFGFLIPQIIYDQLDNS